MTPIKEICNKGAQSVYDVNKTHHKDPKYVINYDRLSKKLHSLHNYKFSALAIVFKE